MTRAPVPADPLDALYDAFARRMEPAIAARIAEAEERLRREFRVDRQLLTVEEAARYLRVRASDFRRLAGTGEIRAVDVDGRRRYYRPHLDEWAASRPA